ncbi:terminase, partial [Actinobaculum suis]|uniref:terminase n=1 Tax=Actinobaculum suis TaxID=1657 RepID=UPI0008087915
MAKDGTNRGGRRVRAGAKPEALSDKLASGRPATRLTTPAELDVFDLDGTDIGDGALLAGEPMPEPGEYLSAEQRDGQPLGADLVYRETWSWLDERGCTEFVSKRLIEPYAQATARHIQCEQAISNFGLPGTHPHPGTANPTPVAPQ